MSCFTPPHFTAAPRGPTTASSGPAAHVRRRAHTLRGAWNRLEGSVIEDVEVCDRVLSVERRDVRRGLSVQSGVVMLSRALPSHHELLARMRAHLPPAPLSRVSSFPFALMRVRSGIHRFRRAAMVPVVAMERRVGR